MQFNYRYRYLVLIIDVNVYVYKYEKYQFDPPFFSFQAKNIFIGKSKVCEMTEVSGAGDSSEFDGNTVLLECGDNEYVYISGFGSSKFKTDDKIIDYISLMGNNMSIYTFAIGEKCTYFISTNYKYIENDKIEEGTLLNATNNSLDPFDYHIGKCSVDSFKALEHTRIQTCWPNVGEDEEKEEDEDDVLDDENEDMVETKYCNGNNEVVKNFNQKCVIYYERDSVYAFRQCGHQCICEQCYQNKGDIDILKCVVCRT